ncbi:MAG: hypothetical protein EBU46_09135 [Nitrosomonadaceae bacterium]|nr:hypothetical protein [Nitrosomonadaceae bacterium]
MEITVNKVANVMMKFGLKRVRKKIHTEWPNTPDWALEGYIRLRGLNQILPDKAANIMRHSDYTEQQVIDKLLH